jgi:hypothetical protein
VGSVGGSLPAGHVLTHRACGLVWLKLSFGSDKKVASDFGCHWLEFSWLRSSRSTRRREKLKASLNNMPPNPRQVELSDRPRNSLWKQMATRTNRKPYEPLDAYSDVTIPHSTCRVHFANLYAQDETSPDAARLAKRRQKQRLDRRAVQAADRLNKSINLLGPL